MPTARRPNPLPDRIRPGLRVLFVGINPGIRSAAVGHHFAGFSNRFWRLLYDSGGAARALRKDPPAPAPGRRPGRHHDLPGALSGTAARGLTAGPAQGTAPRPPGPEQGIDRGGTRVRPSEPERPQRHAIL